MPAVFIYSCICILSMILVLLLRVEYGALIRLIKTLAQIWDYAPKSHYPPGDHHASHV